MEVIKAIKELDKVLNQKNLSYILYICGGAQLVFLGYNTRRTEDVDLIHDVLDSSIKEASYQVAKKLNLEKDWLNNKVFPLAKRLERNWKKKTIVLFEGASITLMGLDRQSLINAKLHAAIERKGEDYQDLLFLEPNIEEINKAEKYCLKQKFDQENAVVFIKAWIKELKNDLDIN